MNNSFFLSALVFLAGCTSTQRQVQSQNQQQTNLPSCIVNKIEIFQKESRQNPPRSITENLYKGEKVYYITAPCCDQYSEVVDSNCKVLGHPDGGITGRGDGKLPGFATEATDAKVIWKDER